MFDRFSENAKRTMSMARKEALALRHGVIQPDHLLLGLLADPGNSAASLLRRLDLDPDNLVFLLRQVLVAGTDDPSTGQMPFTPEAKKGLELAMFEASRLAHAHFGTQHLLLGIVGEGTSMAAQVLTGAGASVDALRKAIADTAMPQRSKLRLLLISNSTMHGGAYLGHCGDEIRDLLGARKRVLFVPYALHDHDAYFDKARQAFAALGQDLVSAHLQQHSPTAVDAADAVFVGGGNTFRLLSALYHYKLLPAIQRRALDGMPYIGSSAGTNLAALSIRTTNDMPIVQPPSFTALELVPFQINPHYLDPDPQSRHMGETREERIRQFHEEHSVPVLGLREGCMLRVTGERLELRGTTGARLFRRKAEPEEFTPPCDLSFLMQP